MSDKPSATPAVPTRFRRLPTWLNGLSRALRSGPNCRPETEEEITARAVRRMEKIQAAGIAVVPPDPGQPDAR